MSDRRRRIIGFLAGMAFGLPYLVVSQYVNVWMLRGVPLFDLPVGRVETVVLGTLAMGIFGLIVAWDEESLWGVLGGAFFGVAISSIQAYVNSGTEQAARSFVIFVFTFLPRVVLYVPVGMFIRWVLNQMEYVLALAPGSVRRGVVVSVVSLSLAVGGGWLSLLSVEARQALKDANALVLEGMASIENGTGLPDALIPVDGFSTHMRDSYTLEWSSDVDSLPVTRPMVGFGVIESLIIVRFEGGYQFGCVYTPPGHNPKCINITRVR
jgi:hypothetical protein